MARELEDEDLPLIADFKVADIPNTNGLIVEQVFDEDSHRSSVTGLPEKMPYRHVSTLRQITGARVSLLLR